MKMLKRFRALALACGMCLLVGSSWSQQPIDTTSRAKERVGRVVQPDLTRGNLDAPAATITQNRLGRPEYNPLPAEVQKKVDAFKAQAKIWLDQQEALKKQLSGATTDTERENIRSKLQALRDQWLERARTFREEFRERLPELKARLRSHGELLDDGKGAARDGRGNHHPRDQRP